MAIGLLALAFGFAWDAAFAQSSGEATEENTLSTSQNWAKNWGESWRDRLARRQSAFQKLLQWQISASALLTLYGQINIGRLSYDDGAQQIESVRDNPNSPSRLGIRLDKDLDGGGNLFINLETAFARGTYDGVFRGGTGTRGSDAWNKTLLRKAEARVLHPSFGYFSIGQGSMGADGITGFDFSGTTVVSTVSVGDSISGVPARFENGAESSLFMQSFFPSFDASRRLRVRYDSLSRNNVSVSLSVGKEVLIENDNNTYADMAIRYETSWRRFGVKGGIGYSYNGSSPAFLSGSVAGLDKSTGLNFAFALGANDKRGRYVFGKLGVIRELIAAGATAFSADYYRSWHPQPAATASQSWGASIVQNLELRDIDLYLTYREFMVDGSIVGILPADAVLFGARFSW